MRERCLFELMTSLTIGNLITLIIFAALHTIFTPLEVVGFWIGTWFVATVCVWSVIDWVETWKRRGA